MDWHTTLRRCRVGLLFGLLSACAAVSFAADDATNKEREARMKKDITYLASPECEGRGPGTQGIDKAAEFIAANFKKAGLKPGGKDGYFQPFSFGGQVKLGSPNTVKLRGPHGQEIELKMGNQFEIMGSSGSGTVNAPVVFAGYGITAKEDDLDYNDFQGADVAGKVVLVLRRTPRWDNLAAPFAGKERDQYATLESKVVNAEKNKAAAVILVNDYTEPRDQLLPFRTLMFSMGGGGRGAKIPAVQLRRDVADEMIRSSLGTTLRDLERDLARDLKPRSRELKGWTVDVATKVQRETFHVKNIIGVLEGSGPLADETVVIGAHYDHLGYGPYGSMAVSFKEWGDPTYKELHPGADDNGSGTTAIMELARRFGSIKNRPGRRLVFMAFSGEERGLFGSQHYCFKDPIFPLKDTVAMVNLDMVGRLAYNEETHKGKLIVEGVGTAKEFGPLIDKLNDKYGFQLSKKQSGLGPSDHDSFCRKNIPVFFLWNNQHEDYHKPSDTADKINVKGMRQIADFAEEIIGHLSKTAKRPEFVQVKETARPMRGKATLGILPDYGSDEDGLVAKAVTAGRPAAKAGLKAGDRIVEIAGKQIREINSYTAVMATQTPGQTIEVVVMRAKKRMAFKVTLEK